MYNPTRGGTRGGQGDFKWSDVAADKDRENYLGHSLNAPVGRWQKNKDLTWYNKDGDSHDAERAEEIRRIKEAEEDALSLALGFAPAPRAPRPPPMDPREAAALAEEAKARRKEERRREKEERHAERERKRLERSQRKQEQGSHRPSRTRSPARRSEHDHDDRRAERERGEGDRGDPRREAGGEAGEYRRRDERSQRDHAYRDRSDSQYDSSRPPRPRDGADDDRKYLDRRRSRSPARR